MGLLPPARAPEPMATSVAGLIVQTARSAGWNWLALAVVTVVAFFLAPFLVHELGNAAYGMWVLIASVTSYMGLLDLGIRGAVTRFVARNHARDDHEAASASVAAALWTRQWIGLAILTLTALIAALLDRFFEIPPQLGSAAPWALLLAGINVAVAVVFGVFGGVLAALHRFDILSILVILQNLVRAGAIVWLVGRGHGILALAAIELVVGVAMNVAQLLICRKIYPELRISFRHPGGRHVRVLWDFSLYAFLIGVGWTLISQTDNVVVGALVSVSAITFYAIGSNLTDQVRSVTASLTSTFAPLASSLDGIGDREKLESLFVQGTRVGLLIGLALIVALFVRGETFISLWMGEEYGPDSGRVLQILLVWRLLNVANATSVNVAFGIAKHKRVAQFVIVEALANLALSLALVERFGIYGVAFGTLLPGLVVQGILIPWYVSRMIGISFTRYLVQGWLSPVVSMVPYAVGCHLAEEHWSPTSLLGFFLEIGAVIPLWFVGAGVCMRHPLMRVLAARRASREPQDGPPKGT